MANSAVCAPSRATTAPPAAGPTVDASRSVTPGQSGGPLQRHPGAFRGHRDHDLLRQVAGPAGRSDHRHEQEQQPEGEHVHQVQQADGGDRGGADHVGDPGDRARSDPVHQRSGERLDQDVGGHLAQGHQPGAGGAAGGDQDEPGECDGRDAGPGQGHGHRCQHACQRSSAPLGHPQTLDRAFERSGSGSVSERLGRPHLTPVRAPCAARRGAGPVRAGRAWWDGPLPVRAGGRAGPPPGRAAAGCCPDSTRRRPRPPPAS